MKSAAKHTLIQFLCFSLFCTLSFAQGTWTTQTSGTTNILRELHFVDLNNGWSVGGNGTIIYTSDGGSTWSPQTSGTSNDLWGVYFTDLNNGWAVGINGTVLNTSNGGSSWGAQSSGTSDHIFGLFFTDADTGWAVGLNGTILHTSNGGGSWGAQTSGISNHLSSVFFIDTDTGWTIGDGGTILKTTNGGGIWSAQTSGTSENLQGLHFIDANTGWAAGDIGTVINTTNGGGTWSTQSTGSSNQLKGIHFINSNTGWTVGSNGTILHSTNAGSSWSSQTSGTTVELREVFFTDANNGWAVGDSGVVLDFATNINLTATSLSDTLAGATGVSVTLAFDTETALVSGDEVAVTFPAGFDVSSAGIDASTATTGSDPTVEGVSGQTVTLNVPDAWSAGSQTIVLTGIDNPTSTVSGISLTVVTQTDNAASSIDMADATPATFYVRAFLNLTATSLSDSYTNATGVKDTVTFTTATQLVSTDEIVIVFPAGFVVSGAGIDASTSTTGSDPTVEGVSGQVVTLNVPDTTSAGSQTIVLTGIENPNTAASGINLTVSTQTNGAAVDIDLPDQTPATFTVVQSRVDLTSTSLSNDYTHASSVNATLNFTTITPLSSTDEITITFPSGFDVSGAGIDAAGTVTTGSDPSVEGVSGQVVTLNVPDAWPDSIQTIVLTGINNPTSASTGLNLTVVTQTDGAALALDFADASPATFDINQSYINLTSTTLSDYFTHTNGVKVIAIINTITPLSATDEIEITFPAGFDLSGLELAGTSSFTGASPTVEGISDTVVTLTAPGSLPAGEQKVVFTGARNSHPSADDVNLTIVTQTDGAALVLDMADPSPVTFDINQSYVNLTDTDLSNYFEDVAGVEVTITFKTITLLDSTDEIEITLPSGFAFVNPTVDTAASTVSGSYPSVESFTDSRVTLTLSDTLTSGTQTLVLTGVTNPSTSAEDISMTVVTQTNGGGLELDFADPSPFTFGVGVILTLDPIGNQTVTAARTLNLTLTGSLIRNDSEIIFSSAALPDRASLESGEFSWLPSPDQIGDHEVKFIASAAGLTKSETITITVESFDIVTDLIIPDTAVIVAELGGTITADSSGIYTATKVVIPPNALQSDQTIIIKPPDTLDIPGSEIEDVLSAVDFVVLGSEEGFTFNDSVDVTVEFKDFEVKKKKKNMRLHFWDKIQQFWKRVRGKHTVDLVNNTVTTKVNHFSIFGVIEVSETTSNKSIGAGWNMVSVPVSPDEITDPIRLFADDISPFRYEENNSNIYIYDEPLNEWILPSTIRNGTGYILYGFDPVEVDLTGLEETADITHSLSYTNSNGWHLLGNPYAVSIDWDSDITKDDGIDDVYYYWNGREYEFYPGGGLTSTIDPWVGFFVHTGEDGESLTIAYPGAGKRASAGLSTFTWRIRIIGETGSNRDTHNYLGAAENAEDEYDGYDVYELAPLNNEFVSVYFPHDEWERRAGNYTQDIRSFDGDKMNWDIVAASKSSNGTVSLSWEIPESLDPEYDVTLTGSEPDEVIDMREQSVLIYTTPELSKQAAEDIVPTGQDPSVLVHKLNQEGTVQKKFTISVGRDLIGEPVNLPGSYYLNQNYPNPFNPATTIEYGMPEKGTVTLKIYNMLGQEIRTLVNKEQPAGIQTITWDGRNGAGIAVSSGVYLYTISVNRFTSVRKLILIK